MDRDQFFGGLFNENSENAEAVRAQRQLAFEERVIKRAVKECGVKVSSWGRLANECRNMTNQQHLNFSWFNTSYPRFPATLCGRRIPKLHELTIQDLFRDPVRFKNRLARAVLTNLQRQEIDTKRSFLFVFPIVRTTFCAHNFEIEPVTSGVQLHMSFRPSTERPLIVQPTFLAFQGIGGDWFE